MKYRCEKCGAILNNSDLAKIEEEGNDEYVHEWCIENDDELAKPLSGD
jgi:hypothetical protein